jgi:hypothetical protein|uniref:Uncharacterized protein n=1 Tax=Desulfobacca acetoxidans TaxID=60893 RepID=A0A7C3SIC7_9BACT
MSRYCHNDVYDGAWNVIKNNCNQMTVCSQFPTTRTEAVSTYMLAAVSMSSADFTLGAGSSGRKITVGAKSGTVSTSGTATHVALVDGTRLLYVTECQAQALTAGNQVNIPSWEAEIKAPTAPA